MTDTTRLKVLANLRRARGDLVCARLAALDAQLHLAFAPEAGLRAKRAAELCDLISNAVAHAERLIFFVRGDGA
jgi:hypothetical protein